VSSGLLHRKNGINYRKQETSRVLEKECVQNQNILYMKVDTIKFWF
jgi:hypothetical protein